MSDLVSVVIPTYNRGCEIQRCLESVLAQTYKHFEVLVVDDGSDPEDPTEEVVRRLDDSRLRYLRLESHTNANVARNAGIQAARGIYVAMLDSDDEWFPVHLEYRVQRMQQERCDGLYGSYQVFDGVQHTPNRTRNIDRGESVVDFILRRQGGAATPTHFYTVESVRDVLWDPELRRHQDYDFVIRYARKYRFLCDQRITVTVNWIQGQVHSVHFPSYIRFYETYRAEIDPAVAARYLVSQYELALAYAQDEPTVQYYRRELMPLAPYLDGRQWLCIHWPRLYYALRGAKLRLRHWLVGA